MSSLFLALFLVRLLIARCRFSAGLLAFYRSIFLVPCYCFIAVGFLLAYSLNSSAQAVNHFTTYTNDDGLPQSSVWSICQDKNGFIWASTSDGVCRFDGYNFHLYKTSPTDKNAIISGRNCSFYRDHAGNLWVASFKGLSLYNADADNFTNYLTYQPSNAAEIVNRVYGEDSTFIWAGMGSYGLIKVNKATHKVYCIKKAGDENFSGYQEWYDGFVAGNNVWFCYTSGVICYNTKTGGLQKVDLGFHARAIASVNDTVLMAQSGKYTFFINKNTGAFTRKNCNLGADNIEIYNILIYSPGKAMLATTRGIYYIDIATGAITRYLQNFEKENKKSFSLAVCLFKDKSGNIWVGTNGTGLTKIAFPFKKFKLYASPVAASNMVKSIYADSGTLYTGYFDNGMDIFSRSNGFVKNVPVARLPHGNGDNVYAITPNAVNSLLLCTANQNVFCLYDKATGRLEELYEPFEKVIPGCATKLNSYCFFTEGRISQLFTGFNEYLLSVNKPLVQSSVPQIVNRFNNLKLCCGWRDVTGLLWVGSANGLYCFKANAWQQIKLPEDVEVKTITQDNDGNIWAGTIHGIYIISADGSIVQHYTEATGLLNQYIYGILKDDAGNMWFSTNKGIGVYWRNKKNFRFFTKEDGLQGNEFNTGAYFKAADGELFFGGINGTNSFYPQDILDNPNTPPVQVTGIKLFDEPYKPAVPAWQQHDIILPYTDNTLAFEFAIPEFTNTLQNKYACMMEGVDKNWIYLGAKNTARYAGLDPGHYTFKVKGANNDGI